MRRVLLALCLAGAAFGQAITYPSSPTSNPNQITVTTAWLFSNKMQYKGAWSSSTTYSTQDLVTYSNASYVSATTGNLNNTPSGVSLFWSQLPGGGGGGAVSSVFGRTGTVTATSGDYTAAQVTNAADQTGSYSNPAWITALAWSKITGAPTFYYQNVQANGSAQTQRATINLINGTNITVSCSDVSSITTCSFSLSGTFNAATATALAATPAQCTSGQYGTGITAAGVANCAQVAYSQLSGTPTLAANTTSTAHQFFSAYNSSTGAFTKGQLACGDLSDAVASCSTDTTVATNITSGALPAAQNTSVFSSAGTGNFWPFGWPSAVVSNQTYGTISNGCTTTCTTYWWEFVVTNTFTARQFIFRMGSVTASAVAAFAVEDSGRNIVAQCTAGQSLSVANVALSCPFASPSSYTFTPGTYFLGYVSNSNTATLTTTNAIANTGLLDILQKDATLRIFTVAGGASLSGTTFTWSSAGTRVATASNGGVVPLIAILP